MKVKETIKDWRKNRRVDTQRFNERVVLIEASREILESLPEDLSYSSVLNGKIHLFSYQKTDSEVRELSAKVREILQVRESTKTLGDDKITYITENDTISVHVAGGDIPSNCRLIPIPHSYITYEMKCEDDKYDLASN